MFYSVKSAIIQRKRLVNSHAGNNRNSIPHYRLIEERVKRMDFPL